MFLQCYVFMLLHEFLDVRCLCCSFFLCRFRSTLPRNGRELKVLAMWANYESVTPGRFFQIDCIHFVTVFKGASIQNFYPTTTEIPWYPSHGENKKPSSKSDKLFKMQRNVSGLQPHGGGDQLALLPQCLKMAFI